MVECHFPVFHVHAPVGVEVKGWHRSPDMLIMPSAGSPSPAMVARAGSPNSNISFIVAASVSSEKSVPKEVDHRKIAGRVQMVDEVKLLLAPEPSEACEFRSCDMIFFVKIYMREERYRAGSGHYEKEVERENKKHCPRNDDRGNQKVGRVVASVAAIGGRHEVAPGIVTMMKSDVIPIKD